MSGSTAHSPAHRTRVASPQKAASPVTEIPAAALSEAPRPSMSHASQQCRSGEQYRGKLKLHRLKVANTTLRAKVEGAKHTRPGGNSPVVSDVAEEARLDGPWEINPVESGAPETRLDGPREFDSVAAE